jgi:hypothetical protein
MKRRPAKFNMNTRRRREIENIIRYRNAADTDDLDLHLVPWAAHNRDSKKPLEAVIMTATRLGGQITTTEATEIIRAAQRLPERMTADHLGRQIRLTHEERQRTGTTTIGGIDADKEKRKELRKIRNREAKEKKRRERGAKRIAEYEAKSLSRLKPWMAECISRKTWYKRRSNQRSR